MAEHEARRRAAYLCGLARLKDDGFRLARRIGARSSRSLQVSRLGLEKGQLVLRLASTHQDLFGLPNEKDMKLLAGRLGVDWALKIVEEEDLLLDSDSVGE